MHRECRERFPRHRLQRKPLVNDSGMYQGTCVMHVPWCMSGSLTSGGRENVPGIPGACATRNFAYLARGPCSIIYMVTNVGNLVYFLANNYYQRFSYRYIPGKLRLLKIQGHHYYYWVRNKYTFLSFLATVSKHMSVQRCKMVETAIIFFVFLSPDKIRTMVKVETDHVILLQSAIVYAERVFTLRDPLTHMEWIKFEHG